MLFEPLRCKISVCMQNKKSKFLFYIGCLSLLLAMAVLFGVYFQTEPVCVADAGASVSEAGEQSADLLSASDIFRDYTQTSLKKQYNDLSVLQQLKQAELISDEVYGRAAEVLGGEAKFVPKREFSSEFEDENKIDQVGDIAKYSQDKLKCIWAASELILTGIYGVPEETFNIFVEADDDRCLPYVIFSQNHGYYLHWFDKIKLKNGMNKIKFPTFGQSYISKEEIRGGAVYLCNPYFEEEQGAVKVYIEGGGYYPVFRKGGNEREFLNFLKEYEAERKANNLLDMAELVTDHAIISTTSSSLYEVYFNNDVITPSENLELWGNYFTTLFEFNGIPTSEASDVGMPYDERNDHVKINFRYMTYYQGSGAYSYSYHIGWYYEHYWFADFYHAINPIKGKELTAHLIFGIGHELGHALDNEPRKINETTNNFTAAIAYFKVVGMPHYEQYQPFSKTLSALSNDIGLNYRAYDDGQIMYTKQDYPTNYDHNYLIWWCLEATFPGFWARFNNYFRGEIESGLSDEEKYVYYSSLATQTDLSAYYERWGFYYGKSPNLFNNRFICANASAKFRSLMDQAKREGKIADRYDHFWYADGTQYDFSLAHMDVPQEERAYKGETPSISKIVKTSGSERKIYIVGARDENHLGYEVKAKVGGEWKNVGFTYGSTFTDKNYYATDPTYKVAAINRYFYVSDESEEFSTVSSENSGVCRIDGKNYDALIDAMRAATEGQTIYLLSDCKLENLYVNADITIEIDPSVENDVCIDVNGAYLQCHNQLVLSGKPTARIILDGNSAQITTPVIYGSNSTFKAEYVTFRNIITRYLAGAIYAPGMDLELYDCSFENCKDLRSEGIIHAMGKVKMENCAFTQAEEPCLNISDIENLTISQGASDFSVVFGDFDGVKNIKLEGAFQDDIIEKIEVSPDYMLVFQGDGIAVSKLLYDLKFNGSGSSFTYELKSHEFEFGTERQYELGEHQYVEYRERTSGKIYRTGDKITVNKGAEFDVEIKDKLELTIYYRQATRVVYYEQGGQIYLPGADGSQNEVLAYREGDKIVDAGKIYAPSAGDALFAIYKSYWACRYYVNGELYDVRYGASGQDVDLPQLEEEGFLCWQCGEQFVSGSIALNGDADLIAVFRGDLPEVYELDRCEIRIDGSYTYSGEQIIPNITVYFNGRIVPSACYSVSFANNISASSDAQVEIAAVDGMSTGSKTQTFTILPKQLSKNDVTVTGLKDFVYDGAQTAQTLMITYKGQQIDDFSINYLGDRTNAGKVEVKIAFGGNFTGEFSLEYTIFKANRSHFKVVLDDWVYGQSGAAPRVENIEEEAAISYSYSTQRYGNYVATKPTDAGTYWVKAVAEQSQNYDRAEATVQFTIEKAEYPPHLPATSVTVERKAATLRSVSLSEGWEWVDPDMEIDEEMIKAYAIYKDTQNYKNYRIEITITKLPPKDIGDLSVNIETGSFVYDGTEKTPQVVAKDGEATLVEGVDFDVRYEDNKLAGKGKAIVTFKNDYAGTAEYEFVILKAQKPSVNTTIRHNKKAVKLSDISLPNGFVWENGDTEISGNRMTAKAVYVGDDADSYETTELTFHVYLGGQAQITPPDNSDQGDLTWLAIVVPIAALLVVGLVVLVIVKRRRSSR